MFRRVAAPGICRALTAGLLCFTLFSCTEPVLATRLELVSSVEMEALAGTPLDEPLSVRVWSAEGRPLGGVSVRWSTASGSGTIVPSTTRTDAEGIARAGWTLGAKEGIQSAAATVDRIPSLPLSATAVHLGDTCAGAPLNLELGASILLTTQHFDDFCVVGDPLFTSDFVALVFNGNHETPGPVAFQLVADGIVTPAQSLSSSSSQAELPPGVQPLSQSGAHAVPRSPLQSLVNAPTEYSWQKDRVARKGASLAAGKLRDEFDRAIREIEARELAPLLFSPASSGLSVSSSHSLSAATLHNTRVGDSFVINANSESACRDPMSRIGKVVGVSTFALLVEDTHNPPGGLTAADYQQLAHAVDAYIYPTLSSNFGTPEDVDANRRVVLFFTAEVNRLTPPGAASGLITGYFFARDLFPKVASSRLGSCPASNESELLYLMAPDPFGTINGNQRDRLFVMERMYATIAHELQHLINASRRLHGNGGALYPERIWLDEALSHSAEELVFRAAAGMQTSGNVGASALQAGSNARLAFERYQYENITRLRLFLSNTGSGSFFQSAAPDGAARGAAASFLRYSADRFAGPEHNFWLSLAAGPDTGLRNLSAVIQDNTLDRVRDWLLALYADDAVHYLPQRHSLPSWNYRSLFRMLGDSEYPLRPVLLSEGNLAQTEVGATGGHFFHFGIPPSGSARVRSSAAGPGAENVSVLLLRTR